MRTALPILAALVALSALWLGCSAPPAEPPEPDHGATIQALLPTAEPTEPPVPGVANTPVPVSADTPVRATDTPPPPPTYTPRPAPTRPVAGEREPSVPFQARLLDGSQMSLSETAGTPTLLAFWAPW